MKQSPKGKHGGAPVARNHGWACRGCEVVLEIGASDLENILTMLRAASAADAGSRRDDEGH